jgi:hypothetical protein
MAVEDKVASPSAGTSTTRRLKVGTNVVLAIVLTVGIVAVLQVMAFNAPARLDMTSSGINSLSEASERLIRDLDADVRLTSLYFETDREDEDQPRYRQAARDLLGLYQATNRGKVSSHWVNPLKDHQQFKALTARLQEKQVFAEEIKGYQAYIARYNDELHDRIAGLIESELTLVSSLGGAFGTEQEKSPLTPVEQLFTEWSSQLAKSHDRITTLQSAESPQYSAVVNELKELYRRFGKSLGDVERHGQVEAARASGLNAKQLDYLRGAGDRFRDLNEALEREKESAQELKPLEFEELLGQLGPTTNAILVETEEDARVVDFSSVWPPLREGMPARNMRFKDRAFKGEEKLTAAILRATHKEQTAVVFVRYGGPPLFFGGFMRGMPRPPFMNMKQQLEEANFIVEEWDLKTRETPPEIDPAPTRTIYVVLKPNPPEPGPMGQPSQEPPFGEQQRRAILDAIGEDGRALFNTGWAPGQAMGGFVMPSPYEYADYLADNWGITVDAQALLIQAISIAPGQYGFGRDPISMTEFERSDHPIVGGAASLRMRLPMCAPLELAESPPEGVVLRELLTMPVTDGLWGAKNIQKYQEQATNEYVTKVEGDLEGPFTVAVAAEKGDARIVVISSTQFAVDEVAFAMMLTMRGIHSRNPGNVTLLINSLHWLNDNTQFMDIGQPIDAAVLDIKDKSVVTVVKAITIFIWPALALGCGGVVWWVRRR